MTTKNLTPQTPSQTQIADVVALTREAYMFTFYTPAEWTALAAALLGRGYTVHQSAAIMLSKWTRWACDEAAPDQRYTVAAVLAFLDNPRNFRRSTVAREVAALTVETFGE